MVRKGDLGRPAERAGTSAFAMRNSLFLIDCIIRQRWRKLAQDGNLRPLSIQVISGLGFGAVVLLQLRGALGPERMPRLVADLGLGIWSAWIASALVLGTDFGWHFRSRTCIHRFGYGTSHLVGAVLAPASPVVLVGLILGLLATSIGTQIPTVRLALMGIALWLFAFSTLRLTSALMVMARNDRVGIRATGYTLAAGLVGCNAVAHGLAPMHWLGRIAYAPSGEALEYAGRLLGLAAALAAFENWISRRSLLRGNPGRARTIVGVRVLRSGHGTAQALRRTALLGWMRNANITAAAALGGLSLPAYALAAGLKMDDVGVAIASCAFVLLIPCWTRANLLGIDGSGAWRYVGTRVRPSDVLIQRGRMLSAVQIVMLIPTAVMIAGSWPGGWEGAAAVLEFIVATIAVQDAAGLPLSRAFPEPVSRSDYYSGANPAGGVWLAFGLMAWASAFAVVVAASNPGLGGWIWPAALALTSVFVRFLAVRALRQRSSDVWSASVLTALGAL